MKLLPSFITQQLFQRNDPRLVPTASIASGQIGADESLSNIKSPTTLAAAKARSIALSSITLSTEEEPYKSFLERINQQALLYATESSLYIEGKVYWLVEQYDSEDIESLQTVTRLKDIKVLKPADNQVKYNRGDDTYTYRTDTTYTVPAEQIILFNHYDIQGARNRLADIINIERYALRYKANAIKAYMRPTAIRKIKGWVGLGKPQLEQYVKESKDMINQEDGSFNILHGDAEDDFNYLSPQDDKEFGQMMEVVKKAVSADSGVSASVLGSILNNTYNNIKEFERHFWQSEIVPELNLITSIIENKFNIVITNNISEIPALRQEEREMAEIFNLYATAVQKLVKDEIWTTAEGKEYMATKVLT